MANSIKGKEINNNVLEVIMRDVIRGMEEFTSDNSCGSQLGSLEIVAVEGYRIRQQKTARILQFPPADKKSVKK